MKEPKAFLNAEWRKLIIANYTVNPEILAPYLPAGTQLDLWNNQCYVSLVGFMFLNTRLLGKKIPFHSDFEEVNLRFYVKYTTPEGELRRGVVFIREIVPKLTLTLVANTIYKENYRTMKMEHQWQHSSSDLRVSYSFKKKKWHRFSVVTDLNLEAIPEGSEAEFITEHYWGYTRLSDKETGQYGVEHPRWSVYPVRDYQIDVDFETVYGKDFAFLNLQLPVSVYLAEGSEIIVRSGGKI